MLLMFFGVAYALPVVGSLILQDGQALHFTAAAAVGSGVGALLAFVTRKYRRELKPRDGFLLVTLVWVLTPVFATIPLLLSIPGLSFTDAYFEAMSGLTTTGSTVLTQLDQLPPSINLWRSALHWYGGLGVIVLAIAVLPLLGVGGMQLYRAETPGPVKDEKLTPRIAETAKSLWFTYTGITVVGILALRAAGAGWLDAICLGFSAMGLGGFSNYDDGIAHFDSPAIEGVLIALMVLASINFARHFLAIRRVTLRPYLDDPEARTVVLVLTVSVLFVAGLLYWHGTYGEYIVALRHAAFTVVSIASTTGFVSANYELWPGFVPILLLLLCSITCSTGSTGGGVKMFRTLLLSQQALRELKLLVHPSAVSPVRIGGRVVPDNIGDSVLAFIFLYFLVFVTLTLALLLTGLDFDSAFSAVIASINNTGPGLGRVGPSTTYQSLTDVQTWICIAAMLLGRLEIFSVLVLFTPAFWRK